MGRPMGNDATGLLELERERAVGFREIANQSEPDVVALRVDAQRGFRTNTRSRRNQTANKKHHNEGAQPQCPQTRDHVNPRSLTVHTLPISPDAAVAPPGRLGSKRMGCLYPGVRADSVVPERPRSDNWRPFSISRPQQHQHGLVTEPSFFTLSSICVGHAGELVLGADVRRGRTTRSGHRECTDIDCA
jgi:hypothetical protein